MRTRVVKINSKSPESKKIKEAVDVLSKGGLVAFPTETVYGLGANSKNKDAINKLYEIKKRPKDKPFTFLIKDIKDIDSFAIEVLPAVYRLADRFWPGPLTIVLKSRDSSTVGLRIPRSAVALEVVRQADFPIACPSANLSGVKEPLSANEVLEDLKGKIELVLDGGEVELGTSSTVVDGCSLPFKILRKGFIDDRLIQEIGSKKRILFVCTGNSCRSVMAKALFEKKLKEKGRGDIEVFSAGISAPIGRGASSEVIQLLKDEGIDVSKHSVQCVTEEMLKRNDLILVMERIQEEAILGKSPLLKNRVYLLKGFSQFSQGGLEIEDPLGKGMDVYKRVFSDMKGMVDKLEGLVK